MSLNAEKFWNLQADLYDVMNQRAKQKLPQLYPGFYNYPDLVPIYDGVYDVSAYCTMPVRIMFILKEPYDPDKNLRGGWDFFDKFHGICNHMGFADMLKCIKENPTLNYPICIGMGILGQFGIPFYNGSWQLKNWKAPWNQEWDFKHTPYAYDIVENAKSITKLAIINIGKLLAEKTTSPGRLKKLWPIWGNIVGTQIALCDPHIIICGGTFDVVNDNYFKIKAQTPPPVIAVKNNNGGTKYQMPFYVTTHNNHPVLIFDSIHPSGQFGGNDVDAIVDESVRWIKNQIQNGPLGSGGPAK